MKGINLIFNEILEFEDGDISILTVLSVNLHYQDSTARNKRTAFLIEKSLLGKKLSIETITEKAS